MTGFTGKENNRQIMRDFFDIIRLWGAGLLLVCVVSGCGKSHFTESPELQTVYVAYDSPQPIPPGVVRFCWEEPVVEFQENGPGLDADRKWYVPSSVAVRMVKHGRWRPCNPVPSEVKGETRNER
jgi:hypothetical protein